MSSRLRIALRWLGAALLVVAAVRFGLGGFSSFHVEEHALPNGGYVIEHRFHINYLTLILGLSGAVAFLSGFISPRRGGSGP